MEKIELYSKKCVLLVAKVCGVVKIFFVLLGAILTRIFGNGNYVLSFTKIGRKWYCDVPCWHDSFFENTLMVGGAAKFIERFSCGKDRIAIIFQVTNDMENPYHSGCQFHKISSTITGGAFYKDPHGEFEEEIWLCPVTLFVLGKYPKRILIHNINGYAG